MRLEFQVAVECNGSQCNRTEAVRGLIGERSVAEVRAAVENHFRGLGWMLDHPIKGDRCPQCRGES